MTKVSKFSIFFLLINSLPLILFGFTSTQSIIIVYHAINASDKSIYELCEAFLGIFSALIVSSKYRMVFRRHFTLFAVVCFLFDGITEVYLLYDPFIKGLFDAVVTSLFMPIFWNINDYFINKFYVDVEERIVFQSWLRTTQTLSSSFGAALVFYTTVKVDVLVCLSICASALWYIWAILMIRIMRSKI